MYRQYENPWELEEELARLRKLAGENQDKLSE